MQQVGDLALVPQRKLADLPRRRQGSCQRRKGDCVEAAASTFKEGTLSSFGEHFWRVFIKNRQYFRIPKNSDDRQIVEDQKIPTKLRVENLVSDFDIADVVCDGDDSTFGG